MRNSIGMPGLFSAAVIVMAVIFPIYATDATGEFYGTATRVVGKPMATGEKTKSVISLGSRVDEGQTVVTGPAEEVVLKLTTGDELVITEGSTITIARKPVAGIDRVNVNLAAGFVWTRAKPSNVTNRFSVVTPSAVCGVRGTMFSVRVAPKTGKSGFCVCGGAIQVTSGGRESIVRAGEYLDASDASAPASVARPFNDFDLLKHPNATSMTCLKCHQGGSSRGEMYQRNSAGKEERP